MESPKTFIHIISGKTEDEKPFSCQINLIPMSGDVPDEFWTALLNTLVDVTIMTNSEMEEAVGKDEDTPE